MAATSTHQPWPIPDADGQREFVDRYEQLLVWALRLTGRRDDEAQDLVHDAFVAFAEGQRDQEIRNLNGYLYGMLRNVLRAGRRRADRRLRAPWTTAEGLLGGLRHPGVDALTDLEARQMLVHIARFARERSLQSKAGSARLLRYFHGYAPREIARIMRVPSSNVDDWLKLGRREARAAADAVRQERRRCLHQSSARSGRPERSGRAAPMHSLSCGGKSSSRHVDPVCRPGGSGGCTDHSRVCRSKRPRWRTSSAGCLDRVSDMIAYMSSGATRAEKLVHQARADTDPIARFAARYSRHSAPLAAPWRK